MPFTYVDKQGVTLFQRHLDRIQSTKRLTQETPMPVNKSVSDVAWAAVAAAAREVMRTRKIATFDEAVTYLQEVSHPTYATYLASIAGGSTPPAPTPLDIGKRAAAVAKESAETHVAKRREVLDQITKRAVAKVRAGLAATEEEGRRLVFKEDPATYEAWRTSGYAKGPGVPPPPPDVATVTTGPVYDAVRKMARELRDTDPWSAHAGKTEDQMIQAVFDANPELFTAYRNESYNRG